MDSRRARLHLLTQCYAGPGDEILFTEHAFSMYRVSALSHGATPVTVPETDLTAGVNAILGAVSSWQTYLPLLPIVGGVALASLKELSFTWVGFIAAMGSNLSSALRGILAKKTMGDGVGENMTEARAASRARAP